jgi:uncharacterized protein YcfL
MKPSHLLPAACLGLAALLTAGCNTQRVNSIEPAQPAGQREMVNDKRVLADQSLYNSVRLLGVNKAETPEGFLRIQVEVQNETRRAKAFTYRVEWFDGQGMMMESASTPAMPRTIESKETLVITAVAPTPTAKDFRIKFLEPKTK